MVDIKEYIESGTLELYVLGQCSEAEAANVEQLAAAYPAVRDEIDQIRNSLEAYALANPQAPDPTIKPFLLATVDYTQRLMNGEQPGFPPELHAASKMEEYSEWINREDMAAPADFDEFYARIIGYTPQITTAIAWIKHMAPQEVHDHEFERFLVLEGTCTISIEGDDHQLVPGNVLSIPLHKKHIVKVTSAIPCKIILQRVAA